MISEFDVFSESTLKFVTNFLSVGMHMAEGKSLCCYVTDLICES